MNETLMNEKVQKQPKYAYLQNSKHCEIALLKWVVRVVKLVIVCSQAGW